MRARFKQLLAFFQIVVAMPKVYGVSPMPDFYQEPMTSFEWVDPDWTSYVLPGACIGGGYRSRLLLRGLAPLLLLVVVLIGFAALECVNACKDSRRVSPKKTALSALPAFLFLSFCMCPGVSASIFSAWGCDLYDVDSDAKLTQSFLREDPSLVCAVNGEATDEHTSIRNLAFFFVAIWPIGLPMCYLLLLLACRTSLLEKRTTPLVLATETLHEEYTPACFWWELLPLLQRLTLTGFLLLIPEEAELWRVLTGTMVAFLYFAALLYMRPFLRHDVNLIAIGTQLSLFFVFVWEHFATWGRN